MITIDQFFADTNGAARTRTFSQRDYELLLDIVQDAECAAAHKQPYYWEHNAGTVANAYKYPASTARMGAYTSPSGEVHVFADRVRISGPSCPCIFHGGRRSYDKWFRETRNV